MRYGIRLGAWMGRLALSAYAVFGVLNGGSAAAKDPGADVRSAVVRVEVSRAGRDWSAPWKLLPAESVSGTAFLIAGDRLLTNAHVVRDAEQVTVKKNDGSSPALATVEALDDDCDLAVLRVASKAFLQGMHALKLGELPRIGSSVVTYGYPMGGQELSTTAGVVSRIENSVYAEGLAEHLVVQTDAAINPGNSGGPVVQDGLVAGVAFQTLRTAQNIGDFIPSPVIRHFLDDLADGDYDGFPDLPLRAAKLSSPAYRRKLQLPDNRSGVVVQEVAFGSGLERVLQTDDVIMAIDGHVISDDGTWLLGGVRIPYHHLVDSKAIGDTIHFDVWRDGKRVSAPWKAARFGPWTRLHRKDPRYLVYAGMLFVPITLEYLSSMHPTGPLRAEILNEILFHAWQREEDPDHEMIVLTKIFRNPVNAQIDAAVPAVLERVDGQPVKNLSDLARLLDKGAGKFDAFELGATGLWEAIDREQARAAQASILSSYDIPHDKNL